MRYQIRYMPDTVEDRRNISAFLSRFYPGTSKRFFAQLKTKTEHLKDFPFSCQIYEDDPDYRRMVIGDFLVFYMVDDDNKTVDIHRIFHGAQDICGQLHKD